MHKRQPPVVRTPLGAKGQNFKIRQAAFVLKLSLVMFLTKRSPASWPKKLQKPRSHKLRIRDWGATMSAHHVPFRVENMQERRPGFRVWGLGFRVSKGFGFCKKGLGFRNLEP